MALFEFQDLVGATLVAFDRGPSFPLARGLQVNVEAGDTLGGLVRSETRGAARRRWRLTFRNQPAATITALNTFLATYAGQRGPFKFVDQGAAAVRVRLLEKISEFPLVYDVRSEYECTLIEDLDSGAGAPAAPTPALIYRAKVTVAAGAMSRSVTINAPDANYLPFCQTSWPGDPAVPDATKLAATFVVEFTEGCPAEGGSLYVEVYR